VILVEEIKGKGHLSKAVAGQMIALQCDHLARRSEPNTRMRLRGSRCDRQVEILVTAPSSMCRSHVAARDSRALA
jgi:hypothetical protein